jgi:signal transduction histidine kinase
LRVIALIAALGAAAWLGLRVWRSQTQRPARTPAGAQFVELPTPLEPPSLGRAPVRQTRSAAEPPELPEIPPPPPLSPPLDLNAIIGPLERSVRQRVRGKVRFRFSLLPELWLCRTQGGSVAAIVLDLVAEATAIMDEDGSLILGTRNIAFDETNIYDYPGARIGEFARITVRDNGRALSEAEFIEVFDPSASARPAIAAAAAEVERIGGFIRVETAEGVGTAVHLYFARIAPATVQRLAAAPPPTAEVAE